MESLGQTQSIDYIEDYLHMKKRVGQLYDYLLVKNYDGASEMLVQISTDAKLLQSIMTIMKEKANG